MSLNPLSNPKGVKLLCELCQKPAFIQCTHCRVTYYCGKEHQNADWLGIHEKICQLLIPLRTPMPFFNSEEERQHRQEQLEVRQLQLIELTRTAGQKLLFEGQHDRAIPAALQSLRFAIKVHGLASIELVISYLILGEASVGLGRLTQAEEYLSQAEWTVLKTPKCSNSIKSKLYRNLGLLNAAKGDHDKALRHLANDIYHSSEQYGTDDIHTSGGYFHMANIFYQKNELDIATALFEEVTSIWYKHLSSIVSLRSKTPTGPKGVGPLSEEADDIDTGLDEAQEAEAIQVLNAIYDIRQSDPNQTPSVLARLSHALGMLYYVLQDIDKAKEFSHQAAQFCDVLEDKDMAEEIIEFDKNIDLMV